jgi:HAD superfamily phosphatase (TIGR01668 family)
MDYTYYIKFWLSGFWKSHDLYTQKANSVYEIEYNKLYLDGCRLAVFDVDDTIGEHKGEITQKTKNLFEKLSNGGWKLVLFSNCTQERRSQLINYFKNLNVEIYEKGGKPNPKGFIEICKENNVGPDKSVMIGEKLSTDIYGSYLAGYMYRILVKPYSEIFGGKQSTIIERLLRRVENILT